MGQVADGGKDLVVRLGLHLQHLRAQCRPKAPNPACHGGFRVRFRSEDEAFAPEEFRLRSLRAKTFSARDRMPSHETNP